MCLNIKKDQQVEIAKKAIIVYKALDILQNIDKVLLSKYDGAKFRGIIKKRFVEGKISISSGKNVYFCTDDKGLDGKNYNIKFGYLYSWILDHYVRYIEIWNNEEKVWKPLDSFKLITPYQKYEVRLKKTYSSELITTKHSQTVDIGLHSFTNPEDCKHHGLIAVKCIIPKGSEYYKGMFGSHVSYASTKIRYKEIVYPEYIKELIINK